MGYAPPIGMLMPEHAPDPAVAVRSKVVNDLPNVPQERCVVGPAARLATVYPACRLIQECHQMTARHR